MKLNIAFPETGAIKGFNFDGDAQVRVFFEKRIGQEVPCDALGEEFKGTIARITGGNNKVGQPMNKSVLTNGVVRLLLGKNSSCYRQRRDGERKRKSVRGSYVASDLSALNLSIVKRGEHDIPGLTDAESVVPKRLGPKRANKIRKFFNLSKKDDVRDFVVRREVQSKKEGSKPYTKAPKVQRLITSQRLQRKRHLRSLKVRKSEVQRAQKAEFAKLMEKRQHDLKAERASRKHERANRKDVAKNVGEKAQA